MQRLGFSLQWPQRSVPCWQGCEKRLAIFLDLAVAKVLHCSFVHQLCLQDLLLSRQEALQFQARR